MPERPRRGQLQGEDRDQGEALGAVGLLGRDQADRLQGQPAAEGEVEGAEVGALVGVVGDRATAGDQVGLDVDRDATRELRVEVQVDQAQVAFGGWLAAVDGEVEAELVHPDVDRTDLRAEGGVQLQGALGLLPGWQLGRTAAEADAELVHGDRPEGAADGHGDREDRRSHVARPGQRCRLRRSAGLGQGELAHESPARRVAEDHGEGEPQGRLAEELGHEAVAVRRVDHQRGVADRHECLGAGRRVQGQREGEVADVDAGVADESDRVGLVGDSCGGGRGVGRVGGVPQAEGELAAVRTAGLERLRPSDEHRCPGVGAALERERPPVARLLLDLDAAPEREEHPRAALGLVDQSPGDVESPLLERVLLEGVGTEGERGHPAGDDVRALGGVGRVDVDAGCVPSGQHVAHHLDAVAVLVLEREEPDDEPHQELDALLELHVRLVLVGRELLEGATGLPDVADQGHEGLAEVDPGVRPDAAVRRGQLLQRRHGLQDHEQPRVTHPEPVRGGQLEQGVSRPPARRHSSRRRPTPRRPTPARRAGWPCRRSPRPLPAPRRSWSPGRSSAARSCPARSTAGRWPAVRHRGP